MGGCPSCKVYLELLSNGNKWYPEDVRCDSRELEEQP